MFAALCGENAEFFKQHMMRFVAVAPVVYLDNLPSAAVREACNNETVISAVKAIGPE